MNDVYEQYIRDAIYLIRERATEEIHDNNLDPSLFSDGKVFALRQVLAILQNQADTFGISRASICLDGFDALIDSVDPSNDS